MDFSLSEEQSLLKNSVERFINDSYEFTQRMKVAHSEQGWSAANWTLFAEQGWLAIPFAEEDGGLAFGLAEIMIMMEAFGRGLAVEPFFSTVVLCGGFLRRGGPDLRAGIVPEVVGGEHKLAFAHQEAGMRYNAAQVALPAERAGDRFTLNGDKTVVVHGPDADSFIISARTAGAAGDRDGISLFLVPADAPGLSRRNYRTVDGQPACNLTLSNVEVPASAVIGEVGQALPLIDTVLAEANVALAAEAVGAMSALLDATLEYVKTRKQFGRNLGSFQVIQHRLADMFMKVEQGRSIMLLATLTESREDWLRNVSATMALIGRLSREVSQEAIQLHGGIGMTEELPVAHYHKRLLVIQSLFGDVSYHNARFRTLSAA